MIGLSITRGRVDVTRTLIGWCEQVLEVTCAVLSLKSSRVIFSFRRPPYRVVVHTITLRYLLPPAVHGYFQFSTTTERAPRDGKRYNKPRTRDSRRDSCCCLRCY